MTDREKLLVFLLSDPDDPPTGGLTTVEVAAMLCELGAQSRAMWRDLATPVAV
jgi:hypothetical protein